MTDAHGQSMTIGRFLSWCAWPAGHSIRRIGRRRTAASASVRIRRPCRRATHVTAQVGLVRLMVLAPKRGFVTFVTHLTNEATFGLIDL